MPAQRIKVGLLIDNFFVSEWIYEMLSKVATSEYATISVVIKKQTTKLSAKPQKGFQDIAYSWYRKLENKAVKVKPDAFFPRNISDLIKSTPVLEVKPVMQGDSDWLEERDIQIIKSYEPDVCIKLGFENLCGEILSCPKFGVWAYSYGENRLKKGTHAGVWEVMEGSCETGIALKILTEDADEDDILYRSFSSTNISMNKNLNISCWKAASFIPRKLKELYETKADGFFENVKKNNQYPFFYSKRLYETPSNIRFISFLGKRYFKWLKRKIWNLFNFEQWILLYSFNKENEFPSQVFKYHKLVPPKNKFWADTCVFSPDGKKHFIFFEELLFKTKKAHISVIELDKTGRSSDPRIVLDKPYHLSYPFVFNAGDDIFMIPETSANRTIELYKCISFPDKWEFQMNLMENLHAVDATIHYQDNKFWLFVNIKENKGASAWDELFLFYSNNLLTTNWQSHPQNPVISDVRLARPAGRLFPYKGKLFRPSQDCSCTYGYATNLNEILILNETEYSERKVTTLFPKWNKKVTAAHTFSFSEELTVIDARYKTKK